MVRQISVTMPTDDQSATRKLTSQQSANQSRAVTDSTPTLVQASTLPKGTVFYQRINTPQGMLLGDVFVSFFLLWNLTTFLSLRLVGVVGARN